MIGNRNGLPCPFSSVKNGITSVDLVRMCLSKLNYGKRESVTIDTVDSISLLLIQLRKNADLGCFDPLVTAKYNDIAVTMQELLEIKEFDTIPESTRDSLIDSLEVLRQNLSAAVYPMLCEDTMTRYKMTDKRKALFRCIVADAHGYNIISEEGGM